MRFIILIALATAGSPWCPAADSPRSIAADLKGAYQVAAVDLNRDGRLDLIALASGMPDLVWFENPSWQRHALATNLPRSINLAARDTDGDGIPEIVVAHLFENEASRSAGAVVLLQHDGDPRRPWKQREIDRLSTSHRIRWADPFGDGRGVFVNAPLTGASVQPPEYRGAVPLVFYRPGSWRREQIDASNQGVQHGISIVDWDGRGRDDVMTASFSGIHLYQFKNKQWRRSELSSGDPGGWPKSGASDVAVGRLKSNRFLAAIEPWHGNQVAVYRKHRGRWLRTIVDQTLSDGHTILAADLDRDGLDEIIGGFRGNGGGVFLYRAVDAAGTEWTKEVLEQGTPAAACVTASLDNGSQASVVCIGGSQLRILPPVRFPPLR